MFTGTYESRLQQWFDFRKTLEASKNPLLDVVTQYKQVSTSSMLGDPFNKNSWPSPWQLILDNQYCALYTVLGECYSLQLTDRFKRSSFEIHTGVDRQDGRTCHLLIIDKLTVLGWNETYVDITELPETYYSQTTHVMSPLH